MNERRRSTVSRRRFVKAAAASTVAAPWIVPGSALGNANFVAPSERITMGLIGCGGMGNSNLGAFLGQKDCQVLAVCDVDQNHLNRTRDRVNNHYKTNVCKGYEDFRELIARDDIDTILLCTPDHWHAIPAVMAAKSGKDIYGEKPFSHSHAEGVAMCKALKRYGRIWQTGSWQRSQNNFRRGAELVRNGRIGKVHTVEVGLPSGTQNQPNDKPTDPPPNLNWDMWVGPAPYRPYYPGRYAHFQWRWQLDYGGGQMLDWVGHHNDIAHWGMGFDYSGPVEVEATADWLNNHVWNHPYKYHVISKYPDGSTIKMGSGHHYPMGTKWIGDAGWIYVNRGGVLQASSPDILKEQIGPNEIHLTKSPGHQRQFLDCVKSRRTTLTPGEVAHRSATPGHLGMVALRVGRKIKWDPVNEKIIGDETAQRLLGNAYRSPWTL